MHVLRSISNRLAHILPVPLLVLVLCHCSSDARQGDELGAATGMAKDLSEKDTIDPQYSGDLFSYEQLLVLQQQSDNPESLISQVGDVVIGEDGNYYIEDERERRIVVFDVNGEFIRSIGRVGDGPGEFRSLTILAIENNFILVFDYAHNRATRFHLDGTLADIVTAPSGSPRLEAIYPLGNEDLLLLYRTLETGPSQTMFTRCIATRISASMDTAWSIRTKPVATEYIVARGREENVLGHYYYQGSPAIVLVGENRLLVSSGVDQELTWYLSNGHSESRTSLALPTMTVTKEEENAIREPLEAVLRRNPEARATRLVLENFQLPPVKGHWDQLLVDNSGFIWLRVPDLASRRRQKGGPIYRVLSPDGAYIGNTRLPVMNGYISNGIIAGIVQNAETGEQVLTVFCVVSGYATLSYP